MAFDNETKIATCSNCGATYRLKKYAFGKDGADDIARRDCPNVLHSWDGPRFFIIERQLKCGDPKIMPPPRAPPDTE